MELNEALTESPSRIRGAEPAEQIGPKTPFISPGGFLRDDPTNTPGEGETR